MRPEIQRYLDALDEAGENRVLQGKLVTVCPYPGENGARCLVGCGEDVSSWVDYRERYHRFRKESRGVGLMFDDESRERGLDVVGAEIRQYILERQARRVMTAPHTTESPELVHALAR